MNRRAFLTALGLTTAAAAAPKFIFDMGANLWRLKPIEICIYDCRHWNVDAHTIYVCTDEIASIGGRALLVTGREIAQYQPDWVRDKIARLAEDVAKAHGGYVANTLPCLEF